jgi:hypothetical protein
MFLPNGIEVFNRFDPDSYRHSVCDIEQGVSGSGRFAGHREKDNYFQEMIREPKKNFWTGLPKTSGNAFQFVLHLCKGGDREKYIHSLQKF